MPPGRGARRPPDRAELERRHPGRGLASGRRAGGGDRRPRRGAQGHAGVRPFLAENNLAGALVAITALAAVLVEWAIDRARARSGRAAPLAAAAARSGDPARGDAAAHRRAPRGGSRHEVGARRQHLPSLAFPATGWTTTIAGICVIWAGILLRGWAIVTLGRFFRRDVQVAADQAVVRSGPYAAIRHPAYTGNLLMYAGVGILLGNWGSLAALAVVPSPDTCAGSRRGSGPGRPPRRAVPRVRHRHRPAGPARLVATPRGRARGRRSDAGRGARDAPPAPRPRRRRTRAARPGDRPPPGSRSG